MDYIERIERWNSLILRITSLNRFLANKKATLENIRKQCHHEVVVCLEKCETLEKASTNSNMKCIFCGQESNDKRVFRKSEIIDVSEFKTKNHYNAKAKFKIANAMFLRVAERNFELPVQEIAKIANSKLQVENQKYKEKMLEEK